MNPKLMMWSNKMGVWFNKLNLLSRPSSHIELIFCSMPIITPCLPTQCEESSNYLLLNFVHMKLWVFMKSWFHVDEKSVYMLKSYQQNTTVGVKRIEKEFNDAIFLSHLWNHKIHFKRVNDITHFISDDCCTTLFWKCFWLHKIIKHEQFLLMHTSWSFLWWKTHTA